MVAVALGRESMVNLLVKCNRIQVVLYIYDDNGQAVLLSSSTNSSIGVRSLVARGRRIGKRGQGWSSARAQSGLESGLQQKKKQCSMYSCLPATKLREW